MRPVCPWPGRRPADPPHPLPSLRYPGLQTPVPSVAESWSLPPPFREVVLLLPWTVAQRWTPGRTPRQTGLTSHGFLFSSVRVSAACCPEPENGHCVRFVQRVAVRGRTPSPGPVTPSTEMGGSSFLFWVSHHQCCVPVEPGFLL